jgi:transcription elongation factor Elf1
MTIAVETKYVRLISSRLRNFKQKNTNLWNFSCPICGDSQRNKSKARGYVYAKGNSLLYSCHNCGISTNVGNLIKHVDPSLYQEYVFENYKSDKHKVNSEVISIESPRFDRINTKQIFTNAEYCDKLPEDHFCIQYLNSRKIPKEQRTLFLFTSKYKDFVDEVVPNHGKEIVNDARLVILFYDKNNELIAISGRALENSDKTLRYITIRMNESNDKLVYGLERIDFTKSIKIVEGPIDSLFLDNCIASGDGNLGLAAQRLIDLGADKSKLTLISDNEPRNKEICKLIEKSIKEGYNVVIWPDNIKQKDINEMIVSGHSKSKIESIISNRTSRDIEAMLMFNFWKKV